MKNLNEFENISLPGVGIPYSWRCQGAEEGPTITILGGVHGNETVGVEIVKNLLVKMLQGKVKKGVLQVALGNIEAIKQGTRFVEVDMNRSFGHPKGKSVDVVRANQLKTLLVDTDVLIDIHATIKPSKPFIGCPNPEHKLGWLIPYMGITTLVTGQEYVSLTNPTDSDAFVAAAGGLGITIEAGWLEDPNILQIQKNITDTLIMLGIFEGDKSKIKPVEQEVWDAYMKVYPSEGFEFTKEWRNFEEIPAGTLIATDPNGKGDIIIPEDSIILFPKSKANIVIGNEACIIARKKGG